MTEVAFHFNVPDRLVYTCRLLRKAYAAGGRTAVVGTDEQLQALDQALWTFSALDFIPHCLASAAPDIVSRTPVVLAPNAQAVADAQVLVHLGTEVPAGFERFERLIELVGTGEADRAHARTRWRHYAERGYQIKRHDVAAKE
ncbi:MAG: DNA polymerase III subunit chi [Ottowia sp.]|nr:DNA polymerase III subunit chi [Ottowia sp.]